MKSLYYLPELRQVSSVWLSRCDKTDLISFFFSEIIYFPILPNISWWEYFTSFISSISLEVWNSDAIKKECWFVLINILGWVCFFFFLLQGLFELAFLRRAFFVCYFIFSGFLFVYHNFIRIRLCVTRIVIVLFIILWVLLHICLHVSLWSSKQHPYGTSSKRVHKGISVAMSNS